MAKLRVNSTAIIDLEEIRNYIAEELDNPHAAAETVRSIIETYERLEEFPLLGKSLSSVISIQTEYRYLISGKYIIFYKADNTFTSIYRVLYAGMDYLKVLFGDIT